MQQIINFVIRNKTFLLFLLLFGISIAFTIQSHSYHKSKFINSANFITGGIYKKANGINQYFNLKEENQILVEENKKLKSLLFNIVSDTLNDISIDTSNFDTPFKLIAAKVYNNDYSNTDNYLTLSKGKKDSIRQDFGVITSKGIIGIINNTSTNFSTVLSILNTKSRINAQLKNSNHIGSLIWNAKSPEFTQLTDISKFAPIKIGDTIVTGGQSSIFPKDIPIGEIESFTLDIGGDTYTVQVRLFNDMTNIGHVFIIENLYAEEIKSLENASNE
jgi:rod shape-determining protein MreC